MYCYLLFLDWEKPTVEIFPFFVGNKYVRNGTSLRLTCKSNSNYDSLKFQWSLDHGLFSHAHKQLTFENINILSNGNYSCTVINELIGIRLVSEPVEIQVACKYISVLFAYIFFHLEIQSSFLYRSRREKSKSCK